MEEALALQMEFQPLFVDLDGKKYESDWKELFKDVEADKPDPPVCRFGVDEPSGEYDGFDFC